MFDQELHVSFEGPEVSENGVPLDDLRKTFMHLQNAFWLAVSHLEKSVTRTGQAPAWIKRGCGLRLVRTSPGSLVAELGVVPLTDARASFSDSSQKAIDLIMQRQPEGSNPLPASIAEGLSRIGESLSPEVDLVRLYNPNKHHFLEIHRNDQSDLEIYAVGASKAPAKNIPAILHGRIMEVDWGKRTAQLHRNADRPVMLQFKPAMANDIYRLARQSVEVKGRVRLNNNNEWVSVQIEQIESTRSYSLPFDLEAFRNNPNPKVLIRPQ